MGVDAVAKSESFSRHFSSFVTIIFFSHNIFIDRESAFANIRPRVKNGNEEEQNHTDLFHIDCG